jgi:hypothetical protein
MLFVLDQLALCKSYIIYTTLSGKIWIHRHLTWHCCVCKMWMYKPHLCNIFVCAGYGFRDLTWRCFMCRARLHRHLTWHCCVCKMWMYRPNIVNVFVCAGYGCTDLTWRFCVCRLRLQRDLTCCSCVCRRSTGCARRALNQSPTNTCCRWTDARGTPTAYAAACANWHWTDSRPASSRMIAYTARRTMLSELTLSCVSNGDFISCCDTRSFITDNA